MRQVTLAGQRNAAVDAFRKEVARRMLLPPWDKYTENNPNVSYAHCSLCLVISYQDNFVASMGNHLSRVVLAIPGFPQYFRRNLFLQRKQFWLFLHISA